MKTLTNTKKDQKISDTMTWTLMILYPAFIMVIIIISTI